jgi:hypothetical protein
MEITADIQRMREENIDGEDQEEAGEEDTCEGEGKSQSQASGEAGSQENYNQEGSQENCQEGR